MTFGDDRLPARFWSKVEQNLVTGCWLWTGAKSKAGYGQLRMGSKINGSMRTVYAHRLSFQILNPIPTGLELDHLCRRRNCVNPTHLDLVSKQENIRRGLNGPLLKTHCPVGHSYSGENLRVTKAGRRQCKECTRSNQRRYNAQMREVR